MRLLRKLVIGLLVLAFGGYAAVCALLYIYQDDLVFFPKRDSAENLTRIATEQGFLPWKNAAGETIGWQSQEGDPANVTLVVHGNGGNALERAIYRRLSENDGLNRKMYLLEYPGFGNRAGKPSEASLVAAASEAIEMLAKRTDCKIWLLGQSLGTGVACATAGRNPGRIAALILFTPFNSMVAVAQANYRWIPVSLLLRTRFDSEKNLRNYPGPVAVVLAADDSVIPARFGQKLFDGYGGAKRLWVVTDAEHNSMDRLFTAWPEVSRWLQTTGHR